MSEATKPSGAATLTCASCGEAVAAGDVFCESCGATLDAAAAIEVASSAPAAEADAVLCHECGGAIADGFCTQCGAKGRVWRDHFTDAPADHLAMVCDRGIRHHRNEDGAAVAVGQQGVSVLVVCDGVTTAPRSDEVSLAAARLVAGRLCHAGPAPAGVATKVAFWSEEMVSAARAGNAETVGQAHAMGDPPEPPSCTFVAAVVDGDLAVVGWCGDSRAYWLPDASAPTVLSIDHSLGTEMIRRGMSPAEAEADPTCHTITRWFGADSVDPSIEVVTQTLTEPGWVLVCSDGLWNYASPAAELRALISASGETAPLAIAESLVAWANAQGGHDNITAALHRHGPLPQPAPPADPSVDPPGVSLAPPVGEAVPIPRPETDV